MKISKRIILLWFVLYLPFLGYKLYLQFKVNEEYKARYISIRKGFVGTKFDLDNFKDTSGSFSKIDFKRTPITIVDFWFKACSPCIADIKTFSPLLKNSGNQVSVFSVSINNFSQWRDLFYSKEPQFDIFLTHQNNWNHLVLSSTESEKLQNDVPADNIQTLQNKFQTTNFPMYFVMDSSKTIIATPFSLTEYLTVDLLKKQNRFLFFILQNETWKSNSFSFSYFLEYSGLFWIGINILSLINFIRKRNAANKAL
jgi:thiol-disulfide isomerase/thioredoxin